MSVEERTMMLIERLQKGWEPIYMVNKGSTSTTRLALVLDELKQQCSNAATSKET